jgi:hypothetical protein
MVALLLVVIVGSAAVAFDLARLRHERHLIQAAVDLGSLAGAAYLPVADPPSAAIATAAARRVAEANAPQLAGSGLSISYACVVSDPQGNGGDDSGDLAFACGPAPGVTWSGGWTSRGGKALHACNPDAGDLCNTIRLQASSTIEYFFAPIFGNDDGNTGAVRAAACKGYCGQGSSPLDVVFVIDRSRSMSDADVANVKDAIADASAAEDSVLEFYNPGDVHIGLVALPYKNQANCPVGAANQTYPRPVPPVANAFLWQVVPLSDDYRNAQGNLNMGSTLVSRVQCLQRAGSITVSPQPGRGHTNYGNPIDAAQYILQNDPKARPDAPNIIIFLGDGEANQPEPGNPCQLAVSEAAAAKGADTTIFSLAYGAGEPSGGGTGEDPRCTSDGSGSYVNALATSMFADVASDPLNGSTTDDDPGGCHPNENFDGDMYFCESRGEDLEDVFRQIAIATLERTRLLNF